MHLKSLLFLLVFSQLVSFPLSASAQEKSWKAAAVKKVITPEKPLWMGGYAARKGPSEGTLHDLHAKILAVEDPSGQKLIVVTLDLIYVTRNIRNAVLNHLQKSHGLPNDSLLMNASHTHCGPMIRIYDPPGDDRDEIAVYARIPRDQHQQRLRETHEYLNFVIEQINTAADAALANLQPVQLFYSHARCGFSMNRRFPANGTFRNSPNPNGPVDQDVPVLQFQDQNKKLVAILFGYACHNTTLSVMQFNGDYAGFAQSEIEQAHPGCVALFVEGCGGDQNPYPRGKIEYARQHGRSLAMAVEAGLIANPVPVTGKLQTAFDLTDLEYAPPPSKAALEKRAQSSDPYDRRHAELLLDELNVNGKLPVNYPCPVQVISWGDQITMVGIGGEACVDYSLRLKAELATRSPAVWVCGYSNDGFGYVPSKRVLAEGGYEGLTSMRYVRQNLHPGPWAPSIEENIIGKVHELVKQLDE